MRARGACGQPSGYVGSHTGSTWRQEHFKEKGGKKFADRAGIAVVACDGLVDAAARGIARVHGARVVVVARARASKKI